LFIGPVLAGKLENPMRELLSRMWHEQDGVLSFEWTMLASLLTVGIVAGAASVRDAVIDEMGDLTYSMTSLDQSYRIQGPLVIGVHTPTFAGGTGSYRVYDFPRGRSGAAQGNSVLGYSGSTAAGSLFLDARPRVDRRGLPERVPADGPVLPGTPVPDAQAEGIPLDLEE
jgi:Flp pilus assembly pilin Flp